MQRLYYCVVFAAIGISGVENLYAIDSSASVTCFSNLTVQSIQWVDVPPDNSMTSVSDSHEQVLTLMTISRALHGTVFTCEVVNLLPNGETNTSRASFTLNSDEIRKPCVSETLFYIYFVFLVFQCSTRSCDGCDGNLS